MLLLILGSKLIHVSERGPWLISMLCWPYCLTSLDSFIEGVFPIMHIHICDNIPVGHSHCTSTLLCPCTYAAAMLAVIYSWFPGIRCQAPLPSILYEFAHADHQSIICKPIICPTLCGNIGTLLSSWSSNSCSWFIYFIWVLPVVGYTVDKGCYLLLYVLHF